MAGAIDLYSGARSITGTNLLKVNKSPLDQIDEGIEDVVGKQANGAADQVTNLLGTVVQSILGLGEGVLGTAGDLLQYFGNLETFLGELNPLDPHFNPLAAAEQFITTILSPTNLLAGLVSDPFGSAGLTGFIPLENLALDVIEGVIGGAQSVIDAILGGLGFPAGSGTTAEIDLLFTNLTGFLGDFASGDFNPLTAAENFITNILNPAGLLATVEDLLNLGGIVTELENVVDGILGAIPGAELLQPLIDMIFNGLTNSNATDVPLGLIGQEIRLLKNAAATAGDLATQAFEVTQSFGGLLHQLIEDLPIVPIYQGFEDFLANMFNVLATTVGNIFQSLSPSNPGTAVNSNQIAALWAHVETTNTAGLHYAFNPSVALTANYTGTSNPAWAAAGPLLMPSVAPSTNYVWCTSGLKRGMVFTGNPNGATNGDHGLVTDKNQVYCTLQNIGFGNTTIFMSGHYTSGTLGQNVCVKLGYGGPAAIALYVATGADTGMSQQTVTLVSTGGSASQYDLPASPRAGDVLGLQYDGVSLYTIYYNNMPVATWTDTGAVVTHGPGYRETGLIVFDNGFNQPTFGLSDFTALDYV